MARTVNPEEYAAKRRDILNATERLLYTKGYESMTIQDILREVGMSSGAFYHYFPTKPVVLEALIERMQQDAEQPLLPIVHDPHLTALEKLQRFFLTLDFARITNRAFIADLLRVWFADDNAIVREKVYAAMLERRAPLLTLIVQQGVAEGVFTTHYPEQAGEIVLALARGMSSTLARLMLAFAREKDETSAINGIVTTFGAYVDAVERVLGAPAGFLQRLDADSALAWAKMGRDG